MKRDAGFMVMRGNLFDGRGHEDERDLGGVPGAIPVGSRRSGLPSKGRRSSSMGRRTTTRGSTTPHLA